MLNLGSVMTTTIIALGLALVVLGFSEAGWVLRSGLMALVALPVLRLIVVLGTLVRRGDWRFVWASVAVLVLLAVALFWRSH